MSDIKIILVNIPNIKRFVARRALENKLFQPGWSMEEQLSLIRDDKSTDLVDLSVAVKDREFIGVAIYFKPVDRHMDLKFDPTVVMCYVKPEYRNNKIGTRLINGFKIPPNELTSYNGIAGSHFFWKKVGTDHKGWWSDPSSDW